MKRWPAIIGSRPLERSTAERGEAHVSTVTFHVLSNALTFFASSQLARHGRQSGTMHLPRPGRIGLASAAVSSSRKPAGFPWFSVTCMTGFVRTFRIMLRYFPIY